MKDFEKNIYLIYFTKIAGINGGYNGTVLQYSCGCTAARHDRANSSAMGA